MSSAVIVPPSMGGFADRRRSLDEMSSGAVESEFMSAKDAAAFLGIPLRSLYLYVQQGFTLNCQLSATNISPTTLLVAHRLFRSTAFERSPQITRDKIFEIPSC
jgi:hypothetical protein